MKEKEALHTGGWFTAQQSRDSRRLLQTKIQRCLDMIMKHRCGVRIEAASISGNSNIPLVPLERHVAMIIIQLL
ncbi:hypothetical protein T05_12567 [Trichinella murrelli]|uniref:Uncharacterized protein n=1 Tax=Trichinella murrelli TaxID=144512 RepID=A0A0V0T1A3_9BILA|nr:hypothetical protein T05_12567 [Trichinella murrelli]